MALLTALSGLGAKGPACFLVETGSARLMLDLGYGPQPGLWPDVSGAGAVDALLVSHSHRDHAGGFRLLAEVGNPRVHATEIVLRQMKDAGEAQALPLCGSTEVCGTRVTTGRNGHAPGGVWLHLDAGDGLLYMGDASVESALYAYDEPPPAGTVIIDASYGTYDASLAEGLPAFDRAFDAGPVLLPVPAAGRGPEIALHVLRTRRALPHVDEALRASMSNLAAGARACIRPDALAELARLAAEAPAIEGARGVMLAAAADGTSGTAASLLEAWRDAREPAIVFTGYLPPGTPAERLTRSGRATYLRWNVHPRLSDNVRLVRATRANTVLTAFGEARHALEWQAAFAPARVVTAGAVTL